MKKKNFKRCITVLAMALAMVMCVIAPVNAMIIEEGIVPGKITVNNVEANRTVYAYAIGYETENGYVLNSDFDGSDIVVDFENPTQEQMNSILAEYKAWDEHTGSSLQGKTYYELVYDAETDSYVLPYGRCSDGAYMIVVDDGSEYVEQIVFVKGMPEAQAGEGDANVTVYKEGETPDEEPPIENPNAAQIAELTAQLEKAQEAKADAVEALAIAEDAYDNASEELSSAVSEAAAVSKELAEARTELAQAKLAKLAAKYRSAKSDAQERVKEAQALVKSLQKDLISAQKEIKAASKDMAIASANVLTAQRNVAKTTAQVNSIQYQLDQLVE